MPLLVWAPGLVPGGRRVDTVASELDVLPTAASLAGVPCVNSGLGRDLLDPAFDAMRYAFTVGDQSSSPKLGLIGPDRAFGMFADGTGKRLTALGGAEAGADVLAREPETARRMEALCRGALRDRALPALRERAGGGAGGSEVRATIPLDPPFRKGEARITVIPLWQQGRIRCDPPFRKGGPGGLWPSRINSRAAASTSAGAMSSRHARRPRGQRVPPWTLQGRHARSRLITRTRSPRGAKPKASCVGPKSATTGVPTAAARCAGPESFATTTRARFEDRRQAHDVGARRRATRRRRGRARAPPRRPRGPRRRRR